jgi:hypothetical protein
LLSKGLALVVFFMADDVGVEFTNGGRSAGEEKEVKIYGA